MSAGSRDDDIEVIWDTGGAEDADADAWEAACGEAVAVLRQALPDAAGVPPPPGLAGVATALRAGLAAATPPYDALARGAGLDPDRLPTDDTALVVRATAGIVSPVAPLELPAGDAAALTVLTFADWLGAVIGLVRAGPGTGATAPDLAAAVAACEEVGGLDPVDVPAVERAFAVVVPVWRACGVVDGGDRLTGEGTWVLPRALARAWGHDIQGSPGAGAG